MIRPSEGSIVTSAPEGPPSVAIWFWTAPGTLFPSLAVEPVPRSVCRDDMAPHRNVRTAPDRTAAPTDIVEARALVKRLLRTIAPNVEVATIDRYESVHDIADLDSLPFPSWEPLVAPRRRRRVPFSGRPYGGSLPVLASRSCPEFCTYCPHRIQSTYRFRSVGNILDELSYLEDARGPLHIVFRDPLFSQQRDRVLELCDGIRMRQLSHTFECETRLDRLDGELLRVMHAAGLRAMSFGVESVAPATLKKVGRRPIPRVLENCRRPGPGLHCRDRWLDAAPDYDRQTGQLGADLVPGRPNDRLREIECRDLRDPDRRHRRAADRAGSNRAIRVRRVVAGRINAAVLRPQRW